LDNVYARLQGNIHLATKLMVLGSKVQGVSQAKGVCPLLRQGHCLVAPRQPLVQIDPHPQCPRDNWPARRPSIIPIEQRRGTVLLGSIEREPLCQMRVRRSWLAQEEQ